MKAEFQVKKKTQGFFFSAMSQVFIIACLPEGEVELDIMYHLFALSGNLHPNSIPATDSNTAFNVGGTPFLCGLKAGVRPLWEGKETGTSAHLPLPGSWLCARQFNVRSFRRFLFSVSRVLSRVFCRNHRRWIKRRSQQLIAAVPSYLFSHPVAK